MVWGLLADGIRKVCACVWNAIPPARMNIDIVVIRLIMRTKVMQKMQKTKAFGKEKSSMLMHEREKPSWWCKGERGLSVTVLDRNINKHLLRKTQNIIQYLSSWLFIFWLLPVCFYLRIVQYVSSGVLIWFILSDEMSHFALWFESSYKPFWGILCSFVTVLFLFVMWGNKKGKVNMRLSREQR